MIPLWVRSHYSLGRGVGSPEALCRRAKELGYDTLALTDRDNLYGLWEFLRASRRHDLRPITGAELTQPHGPGRAVCLVESADGFRNLCRLITRRQMEPGFDLARDLPEHADGLMVLTPTPELLAAWSSQGLDAAAVVGGRPTGSSLELRRLARRLGAPLVAAPGSWFITPADHRTHQVLRAISLNTSLSRLPVAEQAPAEAWLAGPEEYARRFAALPEAISASDALGQRLEFIPCPGVIMPPWVDDQGRSADQALRERAYAGAAWRYGQPLPEPSPTAWSTSWP